MMTDLAISVTNVSKSYPVYDSPRAKLYKALWPGYSKGYREIWALQDINFEVKKGDSMGIIGRNGSGKSTLLEIITKTLSPTTGEVYVDGRVAALLELGSGFNPEYTGRENVFLNGMLMGLSRSQIEEQYDNILSFADIGDVLEMPVKTYSSGMLVRLAFAVQVALEPDILIVDEALSVGDYFFQQKCFGRLRTMRENGLTLLFVSHDMGTVRDLCSRAVYLKEGKSLFIGDSKTAVRKYLSESVSADKAGVESVSISNEEYNIDLSEIKKNAIWSVTEGKEKGRRLLAVCLIGPDGQSTSQARIGDTVKLQVLFRTAKEESGQITLIIKNRYDQIVTSIGTYQKGLAECSSGDSSFAVLEIELDLMIEAGLYSLMVAFGKPIAANRGKRLDETDWFGPIQIDWNYELEKAPFLGMFGLPARLKLLFSDQERE